MERAFVQAEPGRVRRGKDYDDCAVSGGCISDLLLLQLTSDESSFFNYVTALADWLEPYHNHTRPPPAAVLAEAVRHTDIKSSSKNVQINTLNGSPGNGHTKKEVEVPPVKEAPEIVSKFFDGIILLLCC